MKKFKAFLLNKINYLSDKSGFSLIELIIAVAVIAIIATGFAAATVSSTNANLKNSERQKLRESAVRAVDSKVNSKVQVHSTDGYSTTNVKLYKNGSVSPYETKQCYVVKQGGFEGYAKKND